MSEWAWALKHAALDAWESKAAWARRAAAPVAWAALAWVVGVASWGAWDMVRFVEEDNQLVNYVPLLAYARSHDCAGELSDLPRGWRFEAGPSEFFDGPTKPQQLVFACRNEGGRVWIERREARGGAGQWLARIAEEDSLDEKGKAALSRLQALPWEPVRPEASARAWGEALGLRELSEASRGMASSTNAAQDGSAIAWLSRGVLGLFLGVFLAAGLLIQGATMAWAMLALAIMGLLAGAMASDMLGPLGPGGRPRWWGPWRIGIGVAALGALPGALLSWSVDRFATEWAARLGVSGLDAGGLPGLAAATMGALWIFAAFVAVNWAIMAASLVLGSAREAAAAAWLKARAAMDNPEFQARAQRRELERDVQKAKRSPSSGKLSQASPFPNEDAGPKRSPRL